MGGGERVGGMGGVGWGGIWVGDLQGRGRRWGDVRRRGVRDGVNGGMEDIWRGWRAPGGDGGYMRGWRIYGGDGGCHEGMEDTMREWEGTPGYGALWEDRGAMGWLQAARAPLRFLCRGAAPLLPVRPQPRVVSPGTASRAPPIWDTTVSIPIAAPPTPHPPSIHRIPHPSSPVGSLPAEREGEHLARAVPGGGGRGGAPSLRNPNRCKAPSQWD